MGVPEQPIQVLNWPRAYKQTQQTPNTVLFAMVRNAQREPLFQWLGPIYRSEYQLISLTRRRFPLTSTRDAAPYRVGVLRDDYGNTFLTGAGVPESHLEKVNDVGQLVQMLQAGRIDLICTGSDTLHVYTTQQHLDPATFTVEQTFTNNMVLYFAFSKTTDPKLVHHFQLALNNMDAERRRIVKGYGGTP
jgi:polar amino acid transport system substrate-binding protein